MREDMRRALLESYTIRKEAGIRQSWSGNPDMGSRGEVTSGKHLDRVAEIVSEDIASMGIGSGDIVGNGEAVIPGWFRASKRWDVLAFHGGQLVAAVELKSISGSYGKNLNNRVEEALGEAQDASYAVKKDLLNRVIPPLLCYAMIVKKEEESEKTADMPRRGRFGYDPVFDDTSYLDRFRIACERMRLEGIYGAVWFVTVDPVRGTVEEPVPELSYEAFLSEIRGRAGSFLNRFDDRLSMRNMFPTADFF